MAVPPDFAIVLVEVQVLQVRQAAQFIRNLGGQLVAGEVQILQVRQAAQFLRNLAGQLVVGEAQVF